VHIIDWMPTFCALAGYAPDKDLKWDGRNFWPQLTQPSTPPPRRLLYWAGPGFRASASRDGDWKLIVQKGEGKEPGKTELFDLSKDPNETTDLAQQMPARVDSLRQMLADIAKADRDAMVKE
jgi:arylsulfatase A-like enzyme